MIGGLNHNLRHDGKIYHVQTEFMASRGEKKIQTVIFADGAVVRNLMVSCENDADDATAKHQVQHAHKNAIKRILLGQLHDVDNGDSQEIMRARLEEIKRRRQTDTMIAAQKDDDAGSSNVTPIHQKAPLPERVVQAREILVDLVGTAGFFGLGLFNRDGDLTTFLSSSDVDLQAVGPDYLGLFLSARDINAKSDQEILHTLRFDSNQTTTMVLSFEPHLHELYETLSGVMSYVLVQLDASLPMADLLSLVQHFMELISEELLQFVPMRRDGDALRGSTELSDIAPMALTASRK